MEFIKTADFGGSFFNESYAFRLGGYV